MTATLDHPSPPAEATSNTGNDVVLRHPVSIHSANEALFAWLHESEAVPRLNHGVVICPPIGYEHLHTLRSLRHLADELARHGIPTLRFDWSGHGDSAGTDQDPDRVQTWQRNVQDAVEWMRSSLNDAPISVIGLRVGGLLAATSLSATEIENLVLWAPIFHGREFVREMKAIDYAGDAPRNPNGGSEDGIEAAGFVLTHETAKELSALQIAVTKPQTNSILLAQRDDLPVDSRFQTWAESLVGDAEVVTVSGYGDMLREPHRSLVPWDAIHQIREWLCQKVSSGVQHAPLSHDDSHHATNAAPTLRMNRLARITSPDDTYHEEACWIRRGRELFGILTEPARPISSRPTIVLLNSGSNSRIGPGRLNVTLARALAVAGFRTIRIDLQGLGDSPVGLNGVENDPYPSTAVGDVNTALEYLQERYGTHPCVVMGLCSGAYTAFQAAAQITASTFVESILINPLTYFWRDGMTIDDDTTARDLYQQQHYLASAWQPEKWWKLLTGRSQIGLSGAVRLVLRKLRQRRSLESVEPEVDEPQADGVLGHPQNRNLAGDLHRIANRGRHLSLYFAANDPGHQILHSEARTTALKLQASGQMELHVLPHADHTFSREFARRVLIDMITNRLLSRY